MRASGIAASSSSTMRRARALFASLDSRGMISQYRMDVLDLRSDTVTRPTPGMRKAMADAEVGDDVYGEDPTINRLQDRVAEMLGKECSLWAPTGTMANQIAVGSLVSHGDEIVCDRGSHVVNYEGAAVPALWGAQTLVIDGVRGIFDAGALRQVGILAAAGLYALDHHLERLEEDHRCAKAIAEGVQGIRGLRCTMPETNLIFVDVELPMSAVGFAAACKAEGVLCNAEGGKNRVRLVTHLDVPHARAGDVIARLKRAAAR